MARALGLGGLSPEVVAGPTVELDPAATAPADWMAMEGDGTLRRLSLDVGQVNAAFAALNDPRATAKPEAAPPDSIFTEMQVALVSVPAIGQALLSAQDQTNLTTWLQPGDQALMIVGKGIFSFKGSGYVRGGIFDRIVLVQDDVSVRFHDHDHKRLGSIAAKGAPDFTETDLFRIPAASGFDPTKPFRIQLLVQRQVAAVEKDFLTFDLAYQLPPHYLRAIAAPVSAAATSSDTSTTSDESAAQTALWQKIWLDKKVEIAGLAAMLTVLTLVFFFQSLATRNARVFFWFRMGFLTVTLVFLGWYADAQLSVVNLMALFGALLTGFSWQAFLLDPLTFILWFSLAAALLLWGRGAYCGWLCPLGAALAIPARLRMFDWLKRYHECGSPCQTCANDCPVQAIHPTGEINPNECVNCLNCQVLYQSKTKCPVVIRQVKRRDAVGTTGPALRMPGDLINHPNVKGPKHV